MSETKTGTCEECKKQDRFLKYTYCHYSKYQWWCEECLNDQNKYLHRWVCVSCHCDPEFGGSRCYLIYEIQFAPGSRKPKKFETEYSFDVERGDYYIMRLCRDCMHEIFDDEPTFIDIGNGLKISQWMGPEREDN